MTNKCEDFSDPPSLFCHTKMPTFLRPLHIVSQKCLPQCTPPYLNDVIYDQSLSSPRSLIRHLSEIFKINIFLILAHMCFLIFVTDHIPYIHVLSNEWVLYNCRADICRQLFNLQMVPLPS